MGEGKRITFFIAGCVLWEICQLEMTVPIKAVCFRELQSLSARKKGGRRSKPRCLCFRFGEGKGGKYLDCYLQLRDLLFILFHLCQNTHTYTFPEMRLEKIEGLFTIALIAPFPSHPCKAHDCTRAIVWSSNLCFHRCEANAS